MPKHFFKINVENQDYNILFHALSGKIAKIDKVYNDFSDKDLYDEYVDLKRSYHQLKPKVLGIGKIGITFMSARKCNMGCRYCFAGKGEYGNKDNKPDYLNIETYMKTIEKAIELYPEGIKSICFFGGEPLLNFNVIKIFIPKCIDYLKSRSLNIPSISIITNGILIDEEKVEFFREHNILVGLSLDGPKKLNDYGRLLKGKNDSVHDIVVEKVNLLKKYGIGIIIQFTLNRKHVEEYDVGQFRKWLDSMPVLDNINMAIVPVETDIYDLKIKEDSLLKKLDKLAREITNFYIDELYKEKPKKIATGICAPIIQIVQNKYQEDCGAGHSILVDTDGGIYPCHMYCNDDEFLLGNTLEDWIDEYKINKNANLNRMEIDCCKECIAQNVCTYWCKGLSYQANSKYLGVLDPRCIFQKACVEECIKALVRIKKDSTSYKRFVSNLKTINEEQKRMIVNGRIGD